MKYLFAIAVIFAMTSTCISQQIDLTIGTATQAGFSAGLNVKRLFGAWGWYYGTRGGGTAWTGWIGTDYSGIAATEHRGTEWESNSYGMSAGSIYSLDSSGLSIFLGIGYIVKEAIRTDRYRYDFQYLSDEYASETSSEGETQLALEAMIGHDFLTKTAFRLGVQGGYNTGAGWLIAGSAGYAILWK